MSDLPETMFRTTTFDDSTDEHLTPVKSVPLDEAAEDEFWVDAPDDFSHRSAFEWETGEVTVVQPAWVRPDSVCPAFQWIGQPFTSCDRCGQPYWDHTHEEHAADGSLPFSVRVRHKVISPEQRDACRAKWDRRTP